MSTNGLAQIVYHLTQELAGVGHDVTLYARSPSSTHAKLVPLPSIPARLSPLGKVLPVAAAFAHFDIIHDHTRFFSTLFAHLVPTPIVSTVHHPVEFDELHWHHPAEEYATFFRALLGGVVKSVTTVFVSQFQRDRFGREARLISNGIPLAKWTKPGFTAGHYLACLGAINETKGTHEASARRFKQMKGLSWQAQRKRMESIFNGRSARWLMTIG